jgi:putative membrane protein insertion efficiency factor
MAHPVRLSLPAKALLGAQRIYKLTLSPLIGRQCRYLPTCSDYAADCVCLHGAWAGSWMALARVCRCRPGGGSGYDPAPSVCKAVPPFMPWQMGDWRGPSHDARDNETST